MYFIVVVIVVAPSAQRSGELIVSLYYVVESVSSHAIQPFSVYVTVDIIPQECVYMYME